MRANRTSSWAPLLVLACLAASACTGDCRGGAPSSSDAGVVVGDPAALAAALRAIAARSAPVRDYEVHGSVEDVATGKRVTFAYAMAQPNFALGTVDDARDFVFDGKTLAYIDRRANTIRRKDLSHDEAGMLLTLHEVFGAFVCEGWRPPLVKPEMTTARVDPRDPKKWELTMPLDDPKLRDDVLSLRLPTGDFLQRITHDKSGAIARSTRVVSEFVDETTGLSFPSEWEEFTVEGGTQRVRLDSIRVNRGIARERFSTMTPPGFTEGVAP